MVTSPTPRIPLRSNSIESNSLSVARSLEKAIMQKRQREIASYLQQLKNRQWMSPERSASQERLDKMFPNSNLTHYQRQRIANILPENIDFDLTPVTINVD